MKLYEITETSRRQSKKIGDNLSINIKLYEGNTYKYLIMQREDFLHVYQIVNKQGSGILVFNSEKQKGKSQKGEKLCRWCNKGTADNEGYCNNCEKFPV